jgi:hypothetical protein
MQLISRILIIAVDLWLHLATSTVQMLQLVPNNSTLHAFGRGISADCAAYNVSWPKPCSIQFHGSKPVLNGAVESYQTLNHASTINQLLTVNDANSTYVLLGDATVPNNLDYSASTIGLNTECTPITTACNLTGGAGESMPYFCSDGFHGDLSTGIEQDAFGATRWRLSLFNDYGLNNLTGFNATNPTYLGIAAYVLSNAAGNNGDQNYIPLNNDPQVSSTVAGRAFILRCNTTTFDVSYTWSNGSFGTFTNISPSNSTVSSIIDAPQLYNYSFGVAQYVNGAIMAAFSNTSHELADKSRLSIVRLLLDSRQECLVHDRIYSSNPESR